VLFSPWGGAEQRAPPGTGRPFIVTRQSSHSITLSAMASTPGGIVKLSVFAVVRLMLNSNLIGCSTGRSERFKHERRAHCDLGAIIAGTVGPGYQSPCAKADV
jgi:hypothetical protein